MPKQLLRLEPGFSVARYLERSPGAPYKSGRDVASALAEAGVPLRA